MLTTVTLGDFTQFTHPRQFISVRRDFSSETQGVRCLPALEYAQLALLLTDYVDFPQISLLVFNDTPTGMAFPAKTGGLKSEKVAFPAVTR